MDNFNSFIQKIGNRPIYIFLDGQKIGSEHWIIAILWPIIKTLNIQGFIYDEKSYIPEGDVELIMIDDCIYSGHRIMGLIDEFTYKVKNTHRFHFHVITPFSCDTGIENINTLISYSNCKISIHTKGFIKNLINTIDLIKFPIPSIFEKIFQSSLFPLIYFDHKVAGISSTYPQIYIEGILPNGDKMGTILRNLPSRERILELEALYLGESIILNFPITNSKDCYYLGNLGISGCLFLYFFNIKII